MSDPNSVAEWLALAAQHEASARALADNKIAAGQALFHSGLALECAIKAYIMRRERLNAWPSRESRPDLWSHDLRELRKVAELVLDPRAQLAPAWHVLLQWDRGQGYDPRPTPRRVARTYVENTFGPDGLVTWIRQLCL